jgi:hypothetical protein
LPRAPKVRGLMSCRLLRSVDPLSNPRYAPQSIQLLALSLSAANLHDFGEALAVWKTGAAGLALGVGHSSANDRCTRAMDGITSPPYVDALGKY